MKMKCSLEVEIDPAAWRKAYGVPADELADNVLAYLLNQIQQSAAEEEGAIQSVKVAPRPQPARQRATALALDELRKNQHAMDMLSELPADTWIANAPGYLRGWAPATRRQVDFDWVHTALTDY